MEYDSPMVELCAIFAKTPATYTHRRTASSVLVAGVDQYSSRHRHFLVLLQEAFLERCILMEDFLTYAIVLVALVSIGLD